MPFRPRWLGESGQGSWPRGDDGENQLCPDITSTVESTGVVYQAGGKTVGRCGVRSSRTPTLSNGLERRTPCYPGSGECVRPDRESDGRFMPRDKALTSHYPPSRGVQQSFESPLRH